MCDYIMGFVPPGNDLDKIEERLPEPIRRRLGVTFAPIDNPIILSQRPPGDRFVRFTGHRHCDCGIAVACNMPAEFWWWWYYGKTKGEYNLYERSEHKARRWLKEAKRWLSLFRYLASDVGHFGLIVHFGHDLETFTSDRIERLDVETTTPEALMLLDREVIYDVVR